MSHAQLVFYAQQCLILVLKLSLIPIVVATVIGILVSLLQALTQVQEQTLGFAVKLIAISITLMAASSWMGGELYLYTQDIFTHFPFLVRWGACKEAVGRPVPKRLGGLSYRTYGVLAMRPTQGARHDVFSPPASRSAFSFTATPASRCV